MMKKQSKIGKSNSQKSAQFSKFLLLIFLCGFGAIFSSLNQVMASATPPIGTTWTDTNTANPGMGAVESKSTWTLALQKIENGLATFKFTFSGEMSFLSDQNCSTGSMSIPWTRMSAAKYFTLDNPKNGSRVSIPGLSATVEETLSTSANDYQSGELRNCVTSSSPNDSSVASLIIYSNHRFSFSLSDIPTDKLNQKAFVAIDITNNSTGPLGSRGSIPSGVFELPAFSGYPGVSVPLSTTTTSKDIMVATVTTTPLKNTDNTTETTTTDSVVTTTPTIFDTDEVEIDNPLEPGAEATIGDADNARDDVKTSDVLYDLSTESITQKQERQEDTIASLAVTFTVLISSIGAVAPTINALGTGASSVNQSGRNSTTRVASGSLLLPQLKIGEMSKLPSTSSRSSDSNSSVGRKNIKPEVNTARDDTEVHLDNPYSSPENMKPEKGGTTELVISRASPVFAVTVRVLQYISRARIFRPGIQRKAELAVWNPYVPFAISLFVLFGGIVFALLRVNDILNSYLSIIGLTLLSVAAPIYAVLVSLGWFLGRLIAAPSEGLSAIFETLALLPGLLFIPMLVRSLIGPKGNSTRLEHFLSLAIAPVIALFSYRSWFMSIPDVTGTLSKTFENMFGAAANSRSLGVSNEVAIWVAAVAASIAMTVIAVLAMQFADTRGNPKLMFGNMMKFDDPNRVARVRYIEHSTLELVQPTRLGRIGRYFLAFVLISFPLTEILGWKALLLAFLFLMGVWLIGRLGGTLQRHEVHPIYKSLTLTSLGILLGVITVAPTKAFLAFACIGILSVFTLVVKTRSVWNPDAAS